jgi:hypothetical protein
MAGHRRGFLCSSSLRTPPRHARDHPRAAGGPGGSDDPEWEEDEILEREDYSPELLGRELVGDWMNRGVIHVAPDDSLASVCKLMVKNHVHRVLFVERGALKGILTSFDVVAAAVLLPAPFGPASTTTSGVRSTNA